MKRVKSGILGLDQLMGEGFPEGSLNLVSGMSGTGKTLFCIQFLKYGAEHDEAGVLLSFEESNKDIIGDAASLGWDLNRLIKAGKLRIIQAQSYDYNAVVQQLIDTIKEIGAKRLAVDAFSSLALYLGEATEVKQRLHEFANLIRNEMNCTTLLTSTLKDKDSLSRFGVEESIADSLIILKQLDLADSYRKTLTIRKMRKTVIDEKIHTLQIKPKKGLVVQ